MAKTACPVTRDVFFKKAQPLNVEINNIPMTAEPKEFSTGSLGWYLNGKATVKVGDTPVTVQIGMNVTVIGSKNNNNANNTNSNTNKKVELTSAAH